MMLVCFESILVLTVPFKIRFYFLECDDVPRAEDEEGGSPLPETATAVQE
jgi:hypothetical protein